MKIFILNYSSRKNGNCAKTAKFIGITFKQLNKDCDITVSDFPNVGDNTCGKCSYECFGGSCPYCFDDLQKMYDHIIRSDIFISIVPIYGGYPCSNFFVLNERIQGAFDDIGFEMLERVKNKYIVIANTDINVTKQIFQANDNKFCEEDILVLKSSDVGERSIRGNLIEYDYYQKMIISFLERFVK